MVDLKSRGCRKLKRGNTGVPSSPVLHCLHTKKKTIFAESAIKSTTGSTSTFDLIFHNNSAFAPNFSIDPLFGKADMGSLVPFRECDKARAVSVPSFEADLVAEG